jgi:hypothetical protein
MVNGEAPEPVIGPLDPFAIDGIVPGLVNKYWRACEINSVKGKSNKEDNTIH